MQNIYYLWKTNKSKGFTLAEVLTTLVVIGIVAALMIPQLVQSYQERVTATTLKKTYAVLQQAYKMAESEYDSPDTWGNQPDSIPDKLVQYLHVLKNCKTQSLGCLANENYIKLNKTSLAGLLGTANYENYTSLYKFTLNDGVVVMSLTLSYACEAPRQVNGNKACAIILVDTNGIKKPNQAGKDLFIFSLTKVGIFPWGGNLAIYTHNDPTHGCKNTDADGIACAAWVIRHGNMDYLHKTTTW